MQRAGSVSPWFFVLSIIPLSLLGSSVTYSTAAICYIGDVSTGKIRSYRCVYICFYIVFHAKFIFFFRMIAYELAIYVGLMLGSFAAGYAYEASNASTIFMISTGCILAALFLMAALLPESLSTPQTPSQGFVLGDLWRTCSRSRQFKDRSILVLLMCIMLLTAFVSGG